MRLRNRVGGKALQERGGGKGSPERKKGGRRHGLAGHGGELPVWILVNAGEGGAEVHLAL